MMVVGATSPQIIISQQLKEEEDFEQVSTMIW